MRQKVTVLYATKTWALMLTRINGGALTSASPVLTLLEDAHRLSPVRIYKLIYQISLTSRAERLEEELESMREHLKRMEAMITPIHKSHRPIFSSSLSTPTPSHPSHQPAISSVPPSISVQSGGARPDLSHHHQRSLVAPSFGSHQSYADWAFNQLSENAGNLGWEEVTNGLKAVVIQLASALDNMERRNEEDDEGKFESVGREVMMERPFRPSSFQFHGESLFSRVTEPNRVPPLNQQTPMAPPSTTDQSTAEQRSQLSGESPSVSGDQEDSGRESGSITESVVFSAQNHHSSSSQSPPSTSSLITAGASSPGNKRDSMSRARSSLGGYQGVTVEVRYDEDRDGIGGGPSRSRRGSGTRGDQNTIGRSGAGTAGRPMAFPPASQEDGATPMTTSKDMGGDVDGATGRSMGIWERRVNFANTLGRLIRRGPPGNGSPRL
ncbi:hypothetical protein D1P53_004537 [Cryptococcus gattii VGV]|nr:hypothetical protein D1P53_004537 [Cryptococcus gattii VGV]